MDKMATHRYQKAGMDEPLVPQGQLSEISCYHDLIWYWTSSALRSRRVVPFYSHTKGPFTCFSNFCYFPDECAPFRVPDSCWNTEFEALGIPQTVCVEFSEKSIMLCKAARMGDVAKYREIMEVATPKEAKRLGRQVTVGGNGTEWDNERWTAVLVEVAVEAVLQKFSQIPIFQKVLMSTQDAIICEATRSDQIWGIGVNVKDPAAHQPRRWKGTNLLGYALMLTRQRLRVL